MELSSLHLRGEVMGNLMYTSEVCENLALQIKSRIRSEIGEWMRVSIGISYNKLMAKLASNLHVNPASLNNLNLNIVATIGFKL